MKPRTLLVLFLAVAGLGAFVWFYERDLPGTDERAELAKQLLPDLVADSVTRLELTTEKGTTVLEREGGPAPAETGDGDDAEPPPMAAPEWRIVSPLQARADSAAVSATLSTLASMERKRALEDVEPGELGLAEPRARVLVRTGDGAAEVAIGSEIPASQDMVVALGDGPPYFVTGGRLFEQVDKAPGEWRDRDLFPWARTEVERLRVETSGGRVLLARRGDDFWVEEPYTDRADSTAVSKLLTALTGLEAEAFLDEAVEDSGLDSPEVRVEAVVREREAPVAVDLGTRIDAEPPRRRARVAGQEVEVEDQLFGAAAGDPERWRSLDWASLEVFEIDRVEIVRGEETFVLERTDGEWTRDGEVIPFSAASDLLYAVTGAKAVKVDAGELLGSARTRLVLEAEDRSETLEILPSDGGLQPARTSDRPVALWLEEETVRDIEEKLGAVREVESEGAELGVGESVGDEEIDR